MTLLSVENLSVQRSNGLGDPLITGISFTVEHGEVVGIVGESGSGKTLTGLSLIGLLPTGLTASGLAEFDGRNLLENDRKAWDRTRGRKIAMVLQDPTSSLHPMLKIGAQLTDHVRLHLGLDKTSATSHARRMLERVHLSGSETILNQYPHELSGGMRQRVAIAIALACDPELLIADEPTTALDANIRVEIIALLNELREQSDMGIMFITHDLAMLSSFAHRINVFRIGSIVESGNAADVFQTPSHPYTKVLLDAVPRVPWPVPKEVQA